MRWMIMICCSLGFVIGRGEETCCGALVLQSRPSRFLWFCYLGVRSALFVLGRFMGSYRA